MEIKETIAYQNTIGTSWPTKSRGGTWKASALISKKDSKLPGSMDSRYPHPWNVQILPDKDPEEPITWVISLKFIPSSTTITPKIYQNGTIFQHPG